MGTGTKCVLQDLLLDLLSCEEAASLGTEVYAAHAQRMKMKRFLLKLAIAYKHLPTYHVKVRLVHHSCVACSQNCNEMLYAQARQ